MVRKYLKEIGYENNEIEEILESYPFINVKEETLLKNIKKNYEFFITIGYTKEEVIKMTKKHPSIYGLSIENIKQKIEDIVSLGYTKEEVIKLTKSLPALYGYSIENIKQKVEDIISLGYTKEEVIKMTNTLPSIYSLGIENMKQKIEDIISLGYTKEEVIKMTNTLPAIYSYSIENMRQKIEYLKVIGLEYIAINDSKKLMQSVDLTYARYEFLKEKGIEVTLENYRKIFCGNKIFEKQYGITKQEILDKYNYDEYIKEKNYQK